MDFIANSEVQIKEMLETLGISDVEELFRDISSTLRLPRPECDDGMSEFEGMQLMEQLEAKNRVKDYDCYLGAGAYEHHIPALVPAICQKSEFLTAYTPYQAEASQGTLQAIFEFQSAVCALTGLDVANASVYDGASACAEALLMALRHRKKARKMLIAGSLHPHYRAVVDLYLANQEVEICTVPFLADGRMDVAAAQEMLDEHTAAILVQSPNFFGIVEEVGSVFAGASGALRILCANPLSYGIYASAAELGADIAVGDMQPFGSSLHYGGPYAGYMACKQELVRQMPGRIVGETVDTEGRRGFVLTLQPREQHIRREKATSNICSNQALAALAGLIAVLWYGKEGVPALALTNAQRAMYLKGQLEGEQVPGWRVWSEAPIFNEFVVELDRPAEEVCEFFQKKNILAGVPLGRFFPEMGMENHLLVAVTETKNKQQLDRYVSIAREAKEINRL